MNIGDTVLQTNPNDLESVYLSIQIDTFVNFVFSIRVVHCTYDMLLNVCVCVCVCRCAYR